MPRRFAPGWIPTLVALAAVAALCALGVWQLRRHEWREARVAEQRARLERPPVPVEQAIRDPERYRWRRATARGRYDTERTILIQHVRRGMREGARVLTPLRRPGADAAAVLIDRGWIPYDAQERFLEAEGESRAVEVTGVVRPMELGDARPGTAKEPRTAWLRFDPSDPAQPSALQAQLPYRLAPVLLQRRAPATAAGESAAGQGATGETATAESPAGESETGENATGEGAAGEGAAGEGAAGEGDARELPIPADVRPESPVNHLAYAFQWFAFAAIALATWIGLGLKRAREPDPPVGPSRSASG